MVVGDVDLNPPDGRGGSLVVVVGVERVLLLLVDLRGGDIVRDEDEEEIGETGGDGGETSNSGIEFEMEDGG